jgi:prepilin-type N-terminal cleavage/methylation domain-containing protein
MVQRRADRGRVMHGYSGSCHEAEEGGLSSPKRRTTAPGTNGFTLLEILVALILVSMVTLTVALAFKIGVGAWERGVKEGEDPQVRTIIPLLIQRQATAAVKTNSFNGAILPLPFCGQQGSFSFFTAYAPEGSPRQGLMRVSYVFNEAEQTLRLYAQTVTIRDDVKDESNPLSGDWDETMAPISETKGITLFELRYAPAVTEGLKEEPDWKETWDCEDPQWPELIELQFQAGEGPRAHTGVWIFRLGVMGMEAQSVGGTLIRRNEGTVGGGDTRTPGLRGVGGGKTDFGKTTGK